ncbi:MAG TPA: hypothetical protein VNV37_09615 [Solirubrobacteraceae bacterium]|jgi:hypothetical protein|nr:hypothetical protein [Solirubrobacteraceae bacterium]
MLAADTARLSIDPTTAWCEQLTHKHLVPSGQIDRQSDRIAIYRDEEHHEALALVFPLAKRVLSEHVADGRAGGFQLVVGGGHASYRIVAVGAHHAQPTRISAFPTWMPAYPRTALVPRATMLLPFRSEHDLRVAFQACHDAIYKAMANDPAATFDLVLLTLAAKVLDERGPADGVRVRHRAPGVRRRPARTLSRSARKRSRMA